ncbi:solute carrier family 15 member 1-like isoform X2 [Scylla paramamosain]|uniref:solute carrier family 15 member 1-like isoform X2 n=1 Tax=Scylla paramamosain TaxID=85552 RepID=UPI00308377BC
MYRPLLESEGVFEEWDLASSEYEENDHEDEDTEEEMWNIYNIKESTKLLGNEEKKYSDAEQSTEEKVKYPKSVFFIVGNEFCERFSYYGMKAILILYLHNQLKFSEDTSTVIYHVWAMLCYFTPILGAIIADSWLGRFKTIFYISIIYVLGNAVLSISAVSPIFTDLTIEKVITFLGLLLIALGTGGIKPCVSAFGGDQFVLPQQEKQLTQFFFVFYFSINAGSLLSTFITPILRDDVQCFGDDCYSLAFGVPAILMFIALLILVLGYVARLYKIVPPQGTILKEVSGCIREALRKKRKTHVRKKHWLDHAKEKYGEELVADVKVLLKVLVLYIPLPFFWALFDQQGSRWTFQATRMDGTIGSWTLKPDQMQVVNPLLILLMIPLFDRVVYPLLGYCNLLKRQLPRMFTGGVLAGVAFIVSGCLELQLEQTYPTAISSGHSRVTLINTLPCKVIATPSWADDTISMTQYQYDQSKDISIRSENGMLLNEFKVEVNFTAGNCGNIVGKADPYKIILQEKTAHVVLITADGNATGIVVNVDPPDDIEKSSSGLPKLRMLYNVEVDKIDSQVFLDGDIENYKFNFTNINSTKGFVVSGTEYQEVEPDSYDIFLADKLLGKIDVKLGGVYDFLVQRNLSSDNETYQDIGLFVVTEPNSIHMLWLIPQYFIITASEIMFSITGLEFSFTQAPVSMKSVLQAAWLLTVSFGNLIVVIIAEAKFFERQSMEFFLFAALMFVDMVLFAFLAVRYKYVDEIKAENDSTKEIPKDSGKVNEAFSKDETKL